MLQTCMGKAFGAFSGFRWPIFATRLMLFRVTTLQVLEITVRKFIDFGRWTIFDTRLMLFRVLKLESRENIMPNRRQYSGVNFREKKYASRRGPVNICRLDGHIPADVWQKLFTPLERWKKVCFPLGKYEHLKFGWRFYCRRVTKVENCNSNIFHPPFYVKKSMLFAGDQWTFAISMAFLVQTCDNLLWKCRKSRVKRMVSFHAPKWDANFCHTSQVIMQICMMQKKQASWICRWVTGDPPAMQ